MHQVYLNWVRRSIEMPIASNRFETLIKTNPKFFKRGCLEQCTLMNNRQGMGTELDTSSSQHSVEHNGGVKSI